MKMVRKKNTYHLPTYLPILKSKFFSKMNWKKRVDINITSNYHQSTSTLIGFNFQGKLNAKKIIAKGKQTERQKKNKPQHHQVCVQTFQSMYVGIIIIITHISDIKEEVLYVKVGKKSGPKYNYRSIEKRKKEKTGHQFAHCLFFCSFD